MAHHITITRVIQRELPLGSDRRARPLLLLGGKNLQQSSSSPSIDPLALAIGYAVLVICITFVPEVVAKTAGHLAKQHGLLAMEELAIGLVQIATTTIMRSAQSV